MKQLIALTILLISVRSPADSASEEWVKKADSFRNPSEQYKMSITVKTPETETDFEIFLKGTTKTLIVTKAPAKDRGRNMLMLDRDFYAYVPNLKRSVRLSLAQKLSGQVANGDIARTRWFGDYAAITEKKEANQVQLLLDGNKQGLTYQKIRLWVESPTGKPIKAEFLSLDGKTLLKKAFYEDYKDMLGKTRPTQIRIEDVTGAKSLILIKSMQNKELSDSFFTERNMESMH